MGTDSILVMSYYSNAQQVENYHRSHRASDRRISQLISLP